MLQNPYSASDPDFEIGLIPRQEVEQKLVGCLLNARYPSCVSIIAERGMGAQAAVQQFLDNYRHQLPFRVVIIDAKSIVSAERTAASFYQTLVRQVQEQLQPLPEDAQVVANAILAISNANLQIIRSDFFRFFANMKLANKDWPLLLVFYNFDYLLDLFDFSGLDWVWLRQLYDELAYRSYYVIVSRRPLEHIERKGRLNDSNFATRFSGNARRIGLLSKKEAKQVLDRVCNVFGRGWPAWLSNHLLLWSGYNPYCLERSCHILFDRFWNRDEELVEKDKHRLARELEQLDFLGAYFRQLYKSLIKDDLLPSLYNVVNNGYHSAEHDVIQELWHLGYFHIPSEPLPLPKTDFKLFSPLFHRYLLNRDAPLPLVEIALPYDPDSPPIQMPSNSQEKLTPREIDIIRCILEGTIDQMTDQEIAKRLTITKETVIDHIKKIRAKLGLRSRAELIAYIYRYQI